MGACFGKKKGAQEEGGEGQAAEDQMVAAVFNVRPTRVGTPYLAWWRWLQYLTPEPQLSYSGAT